MRSGYRMLYLVDILDNRECETGESTKSQILNYIDLVFLVQQQLVLSRNLGGVDWLDG